MMSYFVITGAKVEEGLKNQLIYVSFCELISRFFVY